MTQLEEYGYPVVDLKVAKDTYVYNIETYHIQTLEYIMSEFFVLHIQPDWNSKILKSEIWKKAQLKTLCIFGLSDAFVLIYLLRQSTSHISKPGILSRYWHNSYRFIEVTCEDFALDKLIIDIRIILGYARRAFWLQKNRQWRSNKKSIREADIVKHYTPPLIHWFEVKWKISIGYHCI